LDTLIRLTTKQWERMRAEVERLAPEEACGLIAGLNGQVLEVIPVPNVLRSPVRFRMEPKDQWQAFQEIEQRGWELVGIYHSHPNGPDSPSATDVAEAFYPEAVSLIWSRRTGSWQCQGFHIEAGQVYQVPILIDRPE
jgi:proteasome lid subunit RPN8/RPN11